jgi:hypothetical protein
MHKKALRCWTSLIATRSGVSGGCESGKTRRKVAESSGAQLRSTLALDARQIGSCPGSVNQDFDESGLVFDGGLSIESVDETGLLSMPVAEKGRTWTVAEYGQPRF